MTDYDLLMFTKHLNQLSSDYINCDDPCIKQKIKDEIIFFSRVLSNL